MSYHVYIARSDPKTQPITEAEWATAARSCPALLVSVLGQGPDGDQHVAQLVGERSQWLTRTPQGLLHAQGPSKAMVEAMFMVAGSLSAQVCSERMRPYASMSDWAARNKRRAPYTGFIKRRRGRWRVLLALLALLALVAAAAVWWRLRR
jgi:hypothetical protein